MKAKATSNVPKSFWVISGAALVWNLLGMMAYVMQVTMDEAAIANLDEAQRAMVENFPTWAVSAFAIAVTAGVLGSLLLLLRRAWAEPVFIVSLVAVVVQDVGAFMAAGGMDGFSPANAVMPVLVIVIGLYLISYSSSAKKKGWIH
jgi:hypothetical protein